MDSQHISDWKYCCDYCDFGTDLIASLWEHFAIKHAETSRVFSEANKDNIVLKMIAELNTTLAEEIEQLKKDTKGAFLELAKAVDECVGSSFKELKTEIDQKISSQMKTVFDNQNEVKQELFVLRNNEALKNAQNEELTEAKDVHEDVHNVKKHDTYASAAASVRQTGNKGINSRPLNNRSDQRRRYEHRRSNQNNYSNSRRSQDRTNSQHLRNRNFRDRQSDLPYRANVRHNNFPRNPRFDQPYTRNQNYQRQNNSRFGMAQSHHRSFNNLPRLNNWQYNYPQEQNQQSYFPRYQLNHDRQLVYPYVYQDAYEIPLSNRFSPLGNY